MSVKGKSTLVTGAAGFIGSHLAQHLLEDGAYVRGLDNFESGHQDNLQPFVDRDGFEFEEGDLREVDTVESVMDGIDYVFHQGALTSVPRSINDPLLTTESNCIGTTNLLKAANNEGVDKVIVASSAAVYGSNEELPKHEDMPVNPESPYALSKYWTEQLAVQFANLYGLETIALRYFNVFGPRQDPTSDYAAVIPKFISLMFDSERPPIYGDGEQSRDFTYIEDIVQANINASLTNTSNRVLNVASGEQTTVNELVDKLNEILSTDIEPRYLEPRSGDVRHSFADISRAREEIGYDPKFSLEDGLVKTIESFGK